MTLTAESGPRVLSRSEAALLWQQDPPSDVRAYLDRNPDLRRDKDYVLDLAYEEYCRLAEAGKPPDLDEFCERFPTYRESLRRVLGLHRYLDANRRLVGSEKQDSPNVCWPVEGETFLGFRLLRELGRGAFARVFLAAEPDLGDRLVAVKVSPHGGNEAQILGRIDHPNVVKVYAVRKDEPSGLTAVCMPYLGGATLEGVLSAFAAGRPHQARVILETARATLGPTVSDSEVQAPHPLLSTATYVEGVCWLGAQIADALAFLHQRNIFHRDLKPSNVLLRPDGRPMLLDFNLSADPQIERQLLGGTLPYMSPEQVVATFLPNSPETAPLDARSDLFSLGVILFELLTGQLPFGQVTRDKPTPEECEELRRRHQQGPPSLHRLCPEATPALLRVVSRCLAFERSQRPPDAAEVAALLRRDLTPLRRAVRRALRHPWKLGGAAVLIATMAAAGIGYLATRPSESDRLIRAAEVAEQRGDDRAALDLIDRGLARAPTDVKGLIVSGRLYQREGRYGLAVRDYHQANLLGPDAQVSACLAYCLGMTNHHRDAIQYNEEAIVRGFAPLEIVYNNLAYHQLAQGQCKKAAMTLDKLLTLAPDLPAAQHNRLVLRRLELRVGKKDHLPTARKDLQQALAICPESPELFGDAADLCAAAGHLDPAWNAEALTYLEKAVKLGLPLGTRPNNDLYRHLGNDPRLKALEKSSPLAAAPVMTARLIDPLHERPAAR